MSDLDIDSRVDIEHSIQEVCVYEGFQLSSTLDDDARFDIEIPGQRVVFSYARYC